MKYLLLFIAYIVIVIIYCNRWNTISTFRKVKILKELIISKQKALELGKIEYEKHGLEFWNPVIYEERKVWMIWARRDVKGSTWIRIDKKTGEILGFITPIR